MYQDDNKLYIGGANQEAVITPDTEWVNPITKELKYFQHINPSQPIATKDPYVDYQFYSPTGNSIVQTINSTPRWQQYWADREGSRISNAMHKVSPKVLDLLMSTDATARLPELVLEIPEIYKIVKYGAQQGLRRISPSYDLYKTIGETAPKVKAGKPTIRTKLGDVEIDNPGLAYRQGNDIGRTYVKYKDVDNSAAQFQIENNLEQIIAKRKNTPYIFKESILDDAIKNGKWTPEGGVKGYHFFYQDTPMYADGYLWYGSPKINETLDVGALNSGLLVSPKNNNFIIGSSKATPYRRTGTGILHSDGVTYVTDNLGRLIPSDAENLGLNLNEIEAFTWKPGYGYKRVISDIPTIKWPNTTRGLLPKLNIPSRQFQGNYNDLFLRELPLNKNSYYRSVDRQALGSYKKTGVVSQGGGSGYAYPMFTKGKPSEYRLENLNNYDTVWLVSKPESKLQWETYDKFPTPVVNGELNKAPISEFDFYVYRPDKGYIKLDDKLNFPGGAKVNLQPHIEYLKSLPKEQQIQYLTQNGLNKEWLWTIENNPSHLENALREAKLPIPKLRVPEHSGKRFVDDFGREIIATPWKGTDQELLGLINKNQIEVLRDYFSPQKKEQIMQAMNWGEKEYAELKEELLRSIGTVTKGEVKGPKDGFTIIAQHSGKAVGKGSDMLGEHTITFNRERIPDEKTAVEAIMHEIGGHGKTMSIKPNKPNVISESFPRMTQLMQKNQELANEILQLNGRGKFFDQFANSADLEKYIYANKIPKHKAQRLFSQFKYYQYMKEIQEKAARAYTGQLMEKLGYNNTENIKQLERFFTPETVQKFKKAVLNYGVPITIGSTLVSKKQFGGTLIQKFRGLLKARKED